MVHEPCQMVLRYGYYYGSQPFRLVRNWRLCRAGRMPIIVLFYHRIAITQPNGWTLHPRTFRRHLDWLGRRFEFISMDRAVELLESGRNDRPRVHITFDDGYDDNCKFAVPLLFRREIPFTYFVTSRNIVEGLPFPHDVARGEPLQPNSPAQLQWIARRGGTIGSHTRTHLDCGGVESVGQLADEIFGSREDLEGLLGESIQYFAFPFGQPSNVTVEALEVVRRAGYRAACSACGGYNFPGTDVFHIRRIHGDPNFVRLKNWLTLDPLKARNAPNWPQPPEPVADREVLV